MKGNSSGKMPGKETLIVLGVVAVVALGFFAFKQQQEPPQSADPRQVMDSGDQLSMAMIDQLPHDYDTLVQMANHYHDLKNYAVATEIYSRALLIDGSSPDVRTDYGACLHDMGLPARAVEVFRQVLSAHPKHVVANLDIGIAFNSLGQTDSARSYWDKCVTLDTSSQAAQLARSYLEQVGP